MASIWVRVATRWLNATIPLKVRINMMVIEDVAARLHPGKSDDVDSQNDAAASISDSTFQMIDDLSRAIESDVRSIQSTR